jgi:hypothetical protein
MTEHEANAVHLRFSVMVYAGPVEFQLDGSSDPRFDSVRNVDFDESARILAEAIQALIASRQLSPCQP